MFWRCSSKHRANRVNCHTLRTTFWIKYAGQDTIFLVEKQEPQLFFGKHSSIQILTKYFSRLCLPNILGLRAHVKGIYM